MIKAVLFDMDGTLVPMDQELFTKKYFEGLTSALAPYGYAAKELAAAVWKGVGAMVKNDGKKLNHDVFWDVLNDIYGERIKGDMPHFDEFYVNDFDRLKSSVGFAPDAAPTVARIKAKGATVVLASNPIFPAIAQLKRGAWAGIAQSDFDYVTSLENSHYCKPDPRYYTEIADALGVKAEDCLMIGNDAEEDGVAASTGMRVFILTDCLINRKNIDLGAFDHGGYAELNAYLGTVGF